MRGLAATLTLTAVLFGCRSTEPWAASKALEFVLGDGRSGVVGEALTLPLLVRVTGRDGDPLPDVAVRWHLAAGDGVMNGQRDDCDPEASGRTIPGDPTNSVTVSTDGLGYAWVSVVPLWFGVLWIQAEVDGSDDRATFRIDASDPDASLTVVAGDDQKVEFTGDQRGENFVVRLTDGHGDPVSDVAVRWEVTSGDGALQLSYNCERVDDGAVLGRTTPDGSTGNTANGVQLRPSVVGTTTVAASVYGVRGSPVIFTVEVEVQLIYLSNPYIGPGFSPADVTLPPGAPIQFTNAESGSARIVSTSVPLGGAPFDSGFLGVNESFDLVLDAVGVWEYQDQETGATGRVTIVDG
jgi:plastocyanin